VRGRRHGRGPRTWPGAGPSWWPWPARHASAAGSGSGAGRVRLTQHQAGRWCVRGREFLCTGGCCRPSSGRGVSPAPSHPQFACLAPLRPFFSLWTYLDPFLPALEISTPTHSLSLFSLTQSNTHTRTRTHTLSHTHQNTCDYTHTHTHTHTHAHIHKTPGARHHPDGVHRDVRADVIRGGLLQRGAVRLNGRQELDEGHDAHSGWGPGLSTSMCLFVCALLCGYVCVCACV
jgi:hypothetical protein